LILAASHATPTVCVLCGAINSLVEVISDPQVQARQMAVAVSHPPSDSLSLVASPMKLSATPVQVRLAPPLLGQYTGEVLVNWASMKANACVYRQRHVV
jgi:crotonobetainyl-CoA:carnitine CoA-transferase CaiB-like acyl-CoA transferase